MPNWTYNTLTVVGKPETLGKLIEECTTGGQLDFEKILPKPDGFDGDLIAGTGDESYALYYDPASPRATSWLSYPWVKEAGVTTVEDLRDFMAERYLENGSTNLREKYPTYQELADAYKRNVDLTGCLHWYDWNVQHWGTKWNASGDQGVIVTGNRAVFEFDTAWSAPEPIFDALAERYPALFFEFVARFEGDSAIVGRSYNHEYEDHIAAPATGTEG